MQGSFNPWMFVQPQGNMFVNQPMNFGGNSNWAAGYTGVINPNQVQNNIVKIPQSELFVQASAYEKSIVDYAPQSNATIATLELCNRVCNILHL